jgi:hypothetical protein
VALQAGGNWTGSDPSGSDRPAPQWWTCLYFWQRTAWAWLVYCHLSTDDSILKVLPHVKTSLWSSEVIREKGRPQPGKRPEQPQDSPPLPGSKGRALSDKLEEARLAELSNLRGCWPTTGPGPRPVRKLTTRSAQHTDTLVLPLFGSAEIPHSDKPAPGHPPPAQYLEVVFRSHMTGRPVCNPETPCALQPFRSTLVYPFLTARHGQTCDPAV